MFFLLHKSSFYNLFLTNFVLNNINCAKQIMKEKNLLCKVPNKYTRIKFFLLFLRVKNTQLIKKDTVLQLRLCYYSIHI